ncbi:hypothetical protein BIV25_03385 [Streptomyces sp. MUSC 14]|uniref:hypothetical protein n=1 Tax=Streptomyces sp. MUSC 14 TaxID=1354889 RepID=UPI0008F5B5BC|nr:hypothetical protein [Streptomyces sp. MUSC 14]OIK02633.1 hypothetical protein BIV25_03385 [Streptomyces sp. MUSC 14]
MEPWSRITEPGTIDDLVADAGEAGYKVTARLVHDWVAKGLLDKPTRRPKGRRGSDKALHAINQRKLFLLLLEKRQQMPKIPSLALVPLNLWLYCGDEYVPTRQAVKALRTWLRDGLRNKDVAREGARGMLQQLDHPLATDTARNRLLRLLTDVGYTGRFDREELAGAARAVFEPSSAFAGTGLIRAVGHPEAALTLENFLTHLEAMCTAIRRIRDGDLDTGLFERVRLVHRGTKSEYLARRSEFAAAASGTLAAAFAEPTLNDLANGCCRELLTIVGYEILRADGRLGHAA